MKAANLKPGDVVRYNGHAAWVIHVNRDGYVRIRINSGPLFPEGKLQTLTVNPGELET